MARTLITSTLLALLALGSNTGTTLAQSATVTTPAAQSVTQYQRSEAVTYRVQRGFLDSIRLTAGSKARSELASAFAERSPGDIWLGLVAQEGLKTGDVADALAAYWILNWVTANRAYGTRVDSQPVRQQVYDALVKDANFLSLNNDQKQEMAEGYILNFLLEHGLLNDAVERRDVQALSRLQQASVARFRQQLGIDLLALEPGPEGLVPRHTAAGK